VSAGLRLTVGAAQWQGPRDRQNDAYLCGDRFAVVADGAGSDPTTATLAYAAAQVWVDLAGTDGQQDMATALLRAPEVSGDVLAARGLSHATTLAGAFLDDRDRLWVTTVGDTRVVVLREGSFLLVSRPHNRAAEMALRLPEDSVPVEATAVLTRFVSAGESAVPDVSVLLPRTADVVVVMSDGVDAVLGLTRVREESARRDLSPQELAELLVDDVRRHGGTDNATCVVARVARVEDE